MFQTIAVRLIKANYKQRHLYFAESKKKINHFVEMEQQLFRVCLNIVSKFLILQGEIYKYIT